MKLGKEDFVIPTYKLILSYNRATEFKSQEFIGALSK
jgi:hypothetical protein